MTYHLLDTSRYYISSRFSRKSNCEPSRGKIEQFPLSIMDIVLGLIVSTIFMAGLSFNSNKHVRPQPSPGHPLDPRVGGYTYYLQHNHSVGHSLSVHYSYLQSNCNNHPSIRKSCGYAIYLVPTISGQPFTHSLLIPCEWLAKPLLTSPHFTSITGTSHRLLLLLTTASADPPPCPVISSCCRSPVQNSSPSSAHPPSSSS